MRRRRRKVATTVVRRSTTVLGAVGVLALSTHPVVAQSATVILATAEDTYRQIETLRAEFTQTLFNPMMGDETTSGVLFLSPPDRFSMRFREPAGDRIVSDGTWLWLHFPSSVPDQVIRQAIPESGTATPNLFAQFVDRPLERYTATYIGVDSVAGLAVEQVRLVPLVSDIPFRSVVISLSSDGMLRKIALIEESGQRRILEFDAVVVNAPIDPEELEFRVPTGTRVVVQ